MKITCRIRTTPFFITTSIVLGFTFAPLMADLSEIPKEGLYFTNGKFTVIEFEKYQDFLYARNGINKLNLKIEKIRNDVFISPSNGPQIPIHVGGFELLSLDKLKTGLDSRVILMITPKIQMTLGEKTIVQFYQKQNKFYFKLETGNIRISATELSPDNKYYFETAENITEISKGDFVASASKTEGTSMFTLSGSLFICLQKDYSISQTINLGDIFTLSKTGETKLSKTNIIHQNFVNDELNFNFTTTDKNVSIFDLLNNITSSQQSLLTKLSNNNQSDKESAQLFDDVTRFIYQDKLGPKISRAEAQAMARMIIFNGKDLTSNKAINSKEEDNHSDYLKELQSQMLIKANKLKELEEQLLRESKEAELKAKSIK